MLELFDPELFDEDELGDENEDEFEEEYEEEDDFEVI